MAIEETSEFDSTRAALAALLRAWRDELVQVARERLPGLSLDKAPQLEVLVDEDGLSISRIDPTGAAPVGRITKGEEAAQALARLVSRAEGETGRDVVVKVASALVLRPQVKLPWASKRTLKSALGFELERLTPIEPNELYFDFIVAGREQETSQALVTLRIVRRNVLDEAMRLCHAAGVQVGAIAFEGDENEAAFTSFPVDRPAWLRAQWRRFASLMLSGLAAFLLVAVVIAGYQRGAAANDDLAASVDDAMTRAALVEHMEHRITTAKSELAKLVAQRQGPLFVGALAELSRLLPDGTWLSELHLEDGKFRIDGYSRNASDLIGIIDRSGQFTNAQFSAPLVRNPNDGTDRFELTFERVPARSPR